MTDVIASARPAATRVTKNATPVTKAATVVASGSKSAVDAPPPFWLAPSIAAHDAVSELLMDAIGLEFEEVGNVADALRVLGVAADRWSQASFDDSAKQADIVESASDTIALLRATLAYPDQTFGAKIQRKIQSALDILRALIEMNFEGPAPLVPALLAAIAAKDNAASGDEDGTSDTQLPDGGRVARCLVWTAASEIEAIAECLLKICEEADLDNGPASLLRMYALRMNAMNSIVLSYLGDDSITLGEVHEKIYGRPMQIGGAA